MRGAGQPARGEAANLQHRIAEIWRELQAANPVYAGEAAALGVGPTPDRSDDDDDAVAELVHRLSIRCAARTAMLEYFAVGPDLVLFVFHDGALETFTLPGANDAVQRLVGFLRLNVRRSTSLVGQDPRALAAMARNAQGILVQLYGVLVAPAADALRHVERLIVVPHGASHHVPFHALHDGERFLIERFEISYSPSAELLKHFDDRRTALYATGAATSPGMVLALCAR